MLLQPHKNVELWQDALDALEELPDQSEAELTYSQIAELLYGRTCAVRPASLGRTRRPLADLRSHLGVVGLRSSDRKVGRLGLAPATLRPLSVKVVRQPVLFPSSERALVPVV
jgi:hypothetical protein